MLDKQVAEYRSLSLLCMTPVMKVVQILNVVDENQCTSIELKLFIDLLKENEVVIR